MTAPVTTPATTPATAADAVRLVRDGARRLVLELGCLGLLVVVAAAAPLGRPTTGWSFAAPALAFTAHAVLGVVVLVEAVTLALRSLPTASGDHVSLPVVGLAGAIVAVTAGAISLAWGPAPVLAVSMAVGWLTATTAYAGCWHAAAVALGRVRRVGRPRVR